MVSYSAAGYALDISDGVAFTQLALDQNIYANSISSGELIGTYSGHFKEINHVEVRGSLIFTSSQDGTLRAFNMKSGFQTEYYVGHEGPVNRFILDKKAKDMWSTSADGIVIQWDVSYSRERKAFGRYMGFPPCHAVALHGKRLVVGYDDRKIRGFNVKSTVLVWETDVKQPVYEMASTSQYVFAPSSRDRIAQLDIKDGTVIRYLQGHTRFPTALRCSKDGKLLFTASEDGTARSWDTATGEVVQIFKPESSVGSLKFYALELDEASGTVFAAGSAGAIYAWDIEQGNILSDMSLGGAGEDVRTIKFDPDSNQLLSVGEGRLVRKHSVNKAYSTKPLAERSGPKVSSLAVHPNDSSRIYVGDRDGDLFKLDNSQQPPGWQKVASVHSRGINAIVITRSGLIVTASWDSTIKIIDSKSYEVIRTLEGHKNEVHGVIVQDDKLFSFSIDNTLKVWELSTGKCIHTFTGHADSITGMDVSGSKLYSVAYDQTIRSWSVETGEQTGCTQLADGERPFSCKVMRGGILCVGTKMSNQILVFELDPNGNVVADSQPKKEIYGHTSAIIRMVKNDDEILLSSGRSGEIIMSDPRSGDVKAISREHSSAVHTMVPLPDGKFVSCAGQDLYLHDLPLLLNRGVHSTTPLVNAPAIRKVTARFGAYSDFALLSLLLLLDVVQLLSFAFTDPRPWKNEALAEIILYFQNFGLISIPFNIALLLTALLVFVFLAAFALQEPVEKAKFLQPKNSKVQYTWLGLVFSSKVVARPLLLPILALLIQIYSCDSVGPDSTIGLRCWEGTHLGYVILSSVVLLFYLPICVRFMLVGGELANIESHLSRPFDWSEDIFTVQWNHPLSFSPVSIPWALFNIFIKVVHTVLVNFLGEESDEMSIILVGLGVLLVLFTYIYPPFFPVRMNRIRVALDWGILWSYIVRLIAIQISPNSDSDWLLYLPIGVIIIFFGAYFVSGPIFSFGLFKWIRGLSGLHWYPDYVQVVGAYEAQRRNGDKHDVSKRKLLRRESSRKQREGTSLLSS